MSILGYNMNCKLKSPVKTSSNNRWKNNNIFCTLYVFLIFLKIKWVNWEKKKKKDHKKYI